MSPNGSLATDIEAIRKAINVRGTAHWKPTPIEALDRIERVVKAAQVFAGQPGVRLAEPFESAWLELREAFDA